MSLDFFIKKCTRANSYCVNKGVKPCHDSTRNKRFGIVDNLAEEDQPAYIQEYREDEWDVKVIKKKAENYEVCFKAIDHCLDFPVPVDPNEENRRCDGMLYFEDRIIFVEIKYRSGENFIDDAMEQLSHTITVFNRYHVLDPYSFRSAYISNSVKPKVPFVSETRKEKFKDANLNFELFITDTIELP